MRFLLIKFILPSEIGNEKYDLRLNNKNRKKNSISVGI